MFFDDVALLKMTHGGGGGGGVDIAPLMVGIVGPFDSTLLVLTHGLLITTCEVVSDINPILLMKNPRPKCTQVVNARVGIPTSLD